MAARVQAAKKATIQLPPSRQALDTPRMLKLIAAAEDIFLVKGYHDATMSDVAKTAGMSKKTVYKLIESKADLFATLLAHHQSLLRFPATKPDWTVNDILSENLLCLGRFLLSPDQIAIVRLIVAEYVHTPDLALMFHEKRVIKARNRLEGCLREVAKAQSLTLHDAREMAAMLFGMALGDFLLGALLGFRTAPGRAAIARRVRAAVDLFMTGNDRLKPCFLK